MTVALVLHRRSGTRCLVPRMISESAGIGSLKANHKVMDLPFPALALRTLSEETIYTNPVTKLKRGFCRQFLQDLFVKDSWKIAPTRLVFVLGIQAG